MTRPVDEAELIEIGGVAAARLARRIAERGAESPEQDPEDEEQDRAGVDEALLRRWQAKGVPTLPLERVLSTMALWPTESLHGARQLRKARWGLLVGAVGCGKSTAAAWWLTQFKTGLWRRSRDIARLPEGAQWAAQEVAELERVPALVIDDIGWRDGDSRGQLAGNVQDVLMARLEDGLPTLCTSNLAPAIVLKKARATGVSWEEYLGCARLRDRWVHRGRWHVSEQESLRGHGGADRGSMG